MNSAIQHGEIISLSGSTAENSHYHNIGKFGSHYLPGSARYDNIVTSKLIVLISPSLWAIATPNEHYMTDPPFVVSFVHFSCTILNYQKIVVLFQFFVCFYKEHCGNKLHLL